MLGGLSWHREVEAFAPPLTAPSNSSNWLTSNHPHKVSILIDAKNCHGHNRSHGSPVFIYRCRITKTHHVVSTHVGVCLRRDFLRGIAGG